MSVFQAFALKYVPFYGVYFTIINNSETFSILERGEKQPRTSQTLKDFHVQSYKTVT